MRIDYYLMILYFLGTLERVMRSLEEEIDDTILFILLRIDYYLMMLSFLGILERVMRDLEDIEEAMMTSKDVQQKPKA